MNIYTIFCFVLMIICIDAASYPGYVHRGVRPAYVDYVQLPHATQLQQSFARHAARYVGNAQQSQFMQFVQGSVCNAFGSCGVPITQFPHYVSRLCEDDCDARLVDAAYLVAASVVREAANQEQQNR